MLAHITKMPIGGPVYSPGGTQNLSECNRNILPHYVWILFPLCWLHFNIDSSRMLSIMGSLALRFSCSASVCNCEKSESASITTASEKALGRALIGQALVVCPSMIQSQWHKWSRILIQQATDNIYMPLKFKVNLTQTTWDILPPTKRTFMEEGKEGESSCRQSKFICFKGIYFQSNVVRSRIWTLSGHI